jgi:hypothetical protein
MFCGTHLKKLVFWCYDGGGNNRDGGVNVGVLFF